MRPSELAPLGIIEQLNQTRSVINGNWPEDHQLASQDWFHAKCDWLSKQLWLVVRRRHGARSYRLRSVGASPLQLGNAPTSPAPVAWSGSCNAFAIDISHIRQEARQHLIGGAGHPANTTNVDRVITVLNQVLASEMVCYLR